MDDEDVAELVDGAAPAPVKIARLWWVVSAAGALLLVVLLGAGPVCVCALSRAPQTTSADLGKAAPSAAAIAQPGEGSH